VFEHVSAPDQVLETAKRMLSERGLLIVAVPDVTGIERFPFPAGHLRLFLHIAHKFNYTAQGLAALARRVGLYASMVPMELSNQAPEIWVAFGRQPLPTGGSVEPTPAHGESVFRQLRGIEKRFIRNTLLRKLGGPFRRFARPAAPGDGTDQS
jgi:hypothetical protein